MKYQHIRPSQEVLAADGLIPKLKDYQTALLEMPPRYQYEYAMHAMNVLMGDPRTIDGAKHVKIRALGTFVLADVEPASMDEILYDGTYIGDALLDADFDELAYVQFPAVRGICLSLVKTEVVLSPSNPEFQGERIESGVYVPVNAVQSVMAA